MGFKSLASILLVGLVLTGCGGGGGSGGGSSGGSSSSSSNNGGNSTSSGSGNSTSSGDGDSTSSGNGDSTSNNTSTTPGNATNCTTEIAGIFGDLLAETNSVRASHGFANLQFSYQLGEAAQGHAEDMATNDYFAHTSPTGSTVASRIDASGYIYQSAGENIAAGHQSVEEVVQAWFDSPGHRENLLNPDFVDIGFGLFFDADSRYGNYWVQEFGEPTNETTVDTRAYIPSNCSIGAITSGDTAVLSGKLTANAPADMSIPVNEALAEDLSDAFNTDENPWATAKTVTSSQKVEPLNVSALPNSPAATNEILAAGFVHTANAGDNRWVAAKTVTSSQKVEPLNTPELADAPIATNEILVTGLTDALNTEVNTWDTPIAVTSLQEVESVSTPEPAFVFGLVSMAIGLGFSKVKHASR